MIQMLMHDWHILLQGKSLNTGLLLQVLLGFRVTSHVAAPYPREIKFKQVILQHLWYEMEMVLVNNGFCHGGVYVPF